MFAEFFLVSGYAFWIIVGIVLVLDVAVLSLADVNDQGWAVFVTAAITLGVVLFTDAFAGIRVSTLAATLAVYLATGVLWSIKKWYDFLIEGRDVLKKEYADEREPRESWEAYATKWRPTASQHKQRITTWMALWPFSLLWWVFTWPRRAFVWLYERLSTIFDRMAVHVFASGPG